MQSVPKKMRWLRPGALWLASGLILTTSFCGCGGGDDASSVSSPADSPANPGMGPGMMGPPSGMMGPGMEADGDVADAGHGDAGAPGGMPGAPGGMPGAPGGMPGAPGGMPGPPGGMPGPPGGMPGAMLGGNPGGMGMMPGMPAGMGTYDDSYGSPPASNKPARPSDPGQWSDEDFQDAVRERDSSVLAAIDARVKSMPGEAAVADLLTSLLAASMEAPKQNTNPYGGGMGMTPGGFPGAAGGFPGAAAGYPSAADGEAAGFGQPGMPAGPAMGSGQGIGNPGAGYPGMGPAPGAPGSPSKSLPSGAGGVPGDAGASIRIPRSTVDPATVDPGVDTLTAMILESAVGFMQISTPGMLGGYGPAGGMPGAGNQPAARLQDRELVKTIAQGLIANGTQEAWKTLHGILVGQTGTPLDAEQSCELVTEELFRHLSPGSELVEQTLMAIVDGTAPLPPANRAACLRIVASVSGAATEKLMGMTPPPPPATPQRGGMGAGGMMMGGFGGPGAAGFPGGSAGDDPDSSEMYSGNPGMMMPGMAGGFGGPGGQQGGQRPAPEGPPLPLVDLDGETLGRAATLLWSPQSVEKILNQLRASADPTSAVELVTLCASLPQATVRSELLRGFASVQPTAADSLMASGLFRHNAYDPGMLVVLKSLPRPRPARNSPAADDAPMEPWTMATQQMVLSLRERLRRSASSLPRYDGAQPVRLHKNAVPELSVVVTLPGAARDFLGDAAPAETKVYYTRLKFTPATTKEQSQVADHYADRAVGQRRADQQKGILWIDGVRVMATGERRSMDVVIQKSAAGSPGAAAGFGGLGAAGGPGTVASGDTYSIEIIVVEATDPKAVGSAVTTTAAGLDADPHADREASP